MQCVSLIGGRARTATGVRLRVSVVSCRIYSGPWFSRYSTTIDLASHLEFAHYFSHYSFFLSFSSLYAFSFQLPTKQRRLFRQHEHCANTMKMIDIIMVIISHSQFETNIRISIYSTTHYAVRYTWQYRSNLRPTYFVRLVAQDDCTVAVRVYARAREY